MCGRFVSSSTPDELAAYFGVDQVAESVLEPAKEGDGAAPAGPRANYNVAPTQDVFAVIEHEDQRHLDAFFWGLIPSWAKEAKIGSRMINARAETLAEKNAYKSSFKRRRCNVRFYTPSYFYRRFSRRGIRSFLATTPCATARPTPPPRQR